jgi:hypothetical protein
MRRVPYLVIAIGLLVQGAAAHADPDSWFPAGTTTDRIGTETWAVNLELAYNAYDDDLFGQDRSVEGTLLRFEFYGQYLAQVGAHRVGVYAWIPAVRSAGTEGDEESALGNPEVGGAFAIVASPVTNLLLRGGLVHPTEDEEDALAILFGSFGRLTDVHTSAPDVTWLRLGGSVLHEVRHGAAPFLLRADLGFDVPFSDDDDIDALLRVNLAAGIDLDTVAVLGELATTGLIGGDADERFLHTVALTARAHKRYFSPSVGLVVPMDDSLKRFLDLVIVIGVRFAETH